MGIEIPEEYGGQGGTFLQALLAIEEIAAVDPSAAVIVDVQNTLVNNAVLRWATMRRSAGGCRDWRRTPRPRSRCRRPTRARTPSR
jgi:alkylation response protein AidB-like acyl-CoA dehydrogenase